VSHLQHERISERIDSSVRRQPATAVVMKLCFCVVTPVGRKRAHHRYGRARGVHLSNFCGPKTSFLDQPSGALGPLQYIVGTYIRFAIVYRPLSCASQYTEYIL